MFYLLSRTYHLLVCLFIYAYAFIIIRNQFVDTVGSEHSDYSENVNVLNMNILQVGDRKQFFMFSTDYDNYVTKGHR